MMKRNFLLIAIAWIVFSSCAGRKNDLSAEEITILDNSLLNNCFDSEFYNCVYAYIQNVKVFFGDVPVYHSIYFFTKDSIDYFTIWTDYSSPELEMKYSNPSFNFRYHSLKINDNDVVIVTKDTYHNDQLYQCCDYLIEKDSIPKHEIPYVIVNDDRLYVETYSYSLKEDKYAIDKLATPIVDIFKDLPERFW